MQKVVSNSSPLIHLAKIKRLDLLKDYFHAISVPEAVYRECVTEGADHKESNLIKKANWINVLQVKDQKLVKLLSASLDEGESEAIALSLEIDAALILLDDYDARERARLYDLKITGTIGILLKAKQDGKIDSLKEELNRLRETCFRISGDLERNILLEVGENH